MAMDVATPSKPESDHGPVGYIYHLSSMKPVRPLGGSLSPEEGTQLVVHGAKEDKQVIQFQFVRVKEFGHFGYIVHEGSKRVVHATDDNKLVLLNERNVNALFSFDLERYIIVHRNGKYWHINGNSPTPKDDTPCHLQKPEVKDVGSNSAEPKEAVINDTAKFYFGNFNAHHIYPYSSPEVSHDWKLLQAFITPKSPRTLVIDYKVGWTKQFSKTNTHGWKISTELASSILKGHLGSDGSISTTETSTVTKEKNVTLTIDVPKDHTVCVWQYVYCIAEYSDEMLFQSNIICDTDSLDKKPDNLKHSQNEEVKNAV